MVKNKSIVSVVIPAYNEEEDIGGCIRTLINQSYKPLEIIFVDDGSTDKTLEILSKYKDIKVLKQDHKGPGAARNFGVSKSKGEITVFVDADMEFKEDYIERLIKPILNGDTIGTNHPEEIVRNQDNIWARCWGRRITTFQGDFAIFRAIKKDKFLETGGFDPSMGYADDQTLYQKLRVRPRLSEGAVCYHKNPATLKEVFYQNRWIGESYKSLVLKISIINLLLTTTLWILVPFLIVIKTINSVKDEKNLKFLFYYPVFAAVKYSGFILGIYRKILKNKVAK